ncbi:MULTISPECIES: hypothetical protein [unclassified Pseudomonas]|uniref:hypothetical protein n=2 Tax=unclassified Pseudomonas TaxID=196821 RepID=UPI002B22FE7E|nr:MULTISPECIES: hypothetical protein [unclassified Pseudomonas]MEB0008564.1 hypothetical protein [Pseudomonas sp. RTB2]MEB0272463.1 hypothetical protein [Pseudomonas sp. 5B4]
MFSKPLTIKAIFALALAVLMAWAGHTYTLSVVAQQPAWDITQDTHHAYGEEETSLSCVSCSDHFHSPLPPDHQHETPQLTSLMSLAEQPKLSMRVDTHGMPFPVRRCS